MSAKLAPAVVQWMVASFPTQKISPTSSGDPRAVVTQLPARRDFAEEIKSSGVVQLCTVPGVPKGMWELTDYGFRRLQNSRTR